MKLGLWLFLLVGLGFAPAFASSPTNASPAAEVDCRTCEGTGVMAGPCRVCHGAGQLPCFALGQFSRIRASRFAVEWSPRALYTAIQAKMEAVLKGFDFGPDELSRRLGQGRVPRSAELREGEHFCPLGCVGGKRPYGKDWIDCKLCRKGKFKCRFCKQSPNDCVVCHATGELSYPCRDCAGLQSFPDPSAAEVQTCPWCLGQGDRECGSCPPSGKVQLECPDCLGLVELPCRICRGLEERACPKCGGFGFRGPSKSKCKDCNKKGVVDCEECERGVVTCATCKGAAVPEVACLDCAGTRRHACAGCVAGSYRAWEYMADGFAAEQSYDLAQAWIVEARQRCEARYVNYLASLDTDPELAKYKEFSGVIEEELAVELERLDARLAELREASAAGE